MKLFARALLTAGFCALSIAGCSKPVPPPLDVQFLGSDLHFTIGGQHIVTPAVAIDRPDHTFDLAGRKPESLRDRFKSASDETNPQQVELLGLSIREYQYTGERLDAPKICAFLTRRWSRLLCRGTHAGLLRRLPERFELLDGTKLELLQNHYTVGRERQYDQVKDMAFESGITEIGCDMESKFCTAAVNVLPGVLAVWTVWPDEQRAVTARAMADTQGAAIVQFVRRGLATVEDPTLADAK